MFCFESAIKLYYYSHIIYHYDKACFPALSCLVSVLCMRGYWLLLALRAQWNTPGQPSAESPSEYCPQPIGPCAIMKIVVLWNPRV